MSGRAAVVAGVVVGVIAACSPSATHTRHATAPGYRVVGTVPHDPQAFTEGLAISDGQLFESTGQFGSGPSIRRVDPTTGRVVKQVAMPRGVYSEGLAVLGGKIYQLTLQNHVVLLYDDQLNRVGERSYAGEAWGLTTVHAQLLLSDGTSTLKVVDPSTFAVRREVKVTDRGAPVSGLNELERVGSDVFANVFGSARIARIDPRTGRIRSWLDLSSLVRSVRATDEEAVLNGIAVDPRSGHLYVTGKLWPTTFELELAD